MSAAGRTCARTVVWTALVAGWLALFAQVSAAPQTADAAATAASHGLAGDDTCVVCHDTLSAAAHRSPHGPGGDLGARAVSRSCETCHGPGQAHVDAGGDKTQIRAFKTGASSQQISDTCLSCHAGAHDGQIKEDCQTCHSIRAARFTRGGFSHDTTGLPLRGLHQLVSCERCHDGEKAPDSGDAGAGARLGAIVAMCGRCHTDAHAGRFGTACSSCHSETIKAFEIARYTHQNAVLSKAFFVGPHAGAPCAACHKRGADAGRAGPTYDVSTACSSCHTDVHRSALGPRCGDCHRVK